MNTKPPLMIIAGPTASGKSALALALSRLQPVTIINADASQVYADLRIISARPTAEEEAQAPHRLFGSVDGATACSAAMWAGMAKAEVARATNEGRLPVLVGGTGLYLRTLLDGIAPVPGIDADIRREVRDMPVADAHAILSALDSEAAQRLSANDRSRICRALEVVRSTGKPLAHWQKQLSDGIGAAYHVTGTILLPPREWLFERIDQRFIDMVDGGGVAEVSRLLERRLDPALPVMRAIGVREIQSMIEAPEFQAEAILRGQLATRQYAKRQFTWFRNQMPTDWEKCDAQLNREMINELAIKLRDMSLTS